VGKTPAIALDLAGAVVQWYGGEGTVLSVVEVPAERSLSEGALVVRRRRALVRRLAELYPEHALQAAVRTAHGLCQGVREAVREARSDLLILPWSPNRRSSLVEDLVADPPCDLTLVRPGALETVRSVLLPVRGGPHAELALRVAEAVARDHGATLTLLHVTLRRWTLARREQEDRYAGAVRRKVTYERTEQLQVEADSVEDVLLAQGNNHDLVVMGAAARDDTSPALVGRIPELLARRLDCTVVVVQTREPVTFDTFHLTSAEAGVQGPDISVVVDRWFAENTFHSHEFRSLRYLMDLKERQGRTISVALPTLNEEKTVGPIISTLKQALIDRVPLIDELVVIDSESDDRTVEIVRELGIPVFQHPQVLPEYGSFRGKGEALWKSLQVTSGDIVVWIDSDITGIHPKFAYGLIGPLLTQPALGFVKGFYRRPLNLGGERLATGGGRVTELTARPLINLFYPQLSGVVQPLAGEMAGRRDVLESVPFFTGYGVETGLLIDILQGFGLNAIAQTDLEERVHRNQTLLSLSKMAFAIVQVVIQRLAQEQRLELEQQMNTSMKLIHYSPTELFLEVKEIEEHERPPIKTLPEYQTKGGGRGVSVLAAAASGVPE
jgi:glucosyl-3-phosphoglycerate synthase